MSGERKSIVIDTSSLGGGSSTKRQSRRNSSSGERKIRPSSIVQPSTLKKTLLERIKQHQRTRERGREREREHDETGTDAVGAGGVGAGARGTNDTGDDNFSQSMDFLRKLALKRRQQQQTTQRRRPDTGVSDAKTPEAKIMNDVAGTLHNGEIVTSTGLLGLPVVPTMTPSPVVSHAPPPAMISLGAMPMPLPTQAMSPMPAMSPISATSTSTSMPMPNVIPKITDLADMYNNTIAASNEPGPTTETGTTTSTSTSTSASEPSLHIPEKPEDYLPSIFIKEEPPHGCLKGGKKPTFREWATKILNKPVDSIKNMFGGGEDQTTNSGSNGGNSSVGGSSVGGSSSSANEASNEKMDIDPENIAGMRVKIRKTKKKRYHIGKHDNVVGVLLKNKQTQRHIQSQHLSLKQKTIGEIRKYLYDHHLLKIGSNAPPDVLRRMYEDSILTGDVKNTNNDVLLHNFMSGGGE